uniref:Fibrinogen C-terminal domain-containing protein n=1 Tax=Electrophorus electricus TaxID=8005 RepID=A0A4W4HB29_ELEEL
MWLSVLFVWGNLLMFAASQSCGETSKDTASWVRLKPLGQCRDGENMCPYSITLPPLTIQLPKHFRDLDKMARELQSLTLMVNQLREECQECRGRQRPEWSVRTDDGGKAGERIQASRGTVNTRERQHDLHKRVRIVQSRTGDNQRMKDIIAQKTTAEGSSKENKKRPFTGINVEDRDNLETQLLNTCQGQYKQQDCSDLKKNMKNGVYSMTPVGSKHASFHVFCDMEASDGGWTLIQRRLDGTISFNRTWDEYKKGFGSLTGEFWLGNDKIHWLTAARAMALRLELEDLDGIKEYAQYDDFYVANESLNYQLTIGEYSGTAGNAMQHSKRFNHNQKYFSTPDRDNDEYPSGNCGAYYSSGWWFDACMAANLNGKYYQTRYKGVRNGIFWGTWHNISNEYYPTNDRQSFKTVRMMIRPRENSVLDV